MVVAMAIFAVLGCLSSVMAYREYQVVRLPRLTPEQLAEQERLAEEARQKELFQKAAVRETKWLMDDIPHELAVQNRMQYAIAEKTGRAGKRKVVKVKLRDALIKSTEVWFPLNSRDFPYGVGFHDLLNDNKFVIANLEKGIRRSCRLEVDPIYHDVYLAVAFRNSLGGLPLTVHWSKIIHTLTPEQPFNVVLGINKSGRMVSQDLTKWPHGLVLGGTGNGKTTFIKQAFCTLIRRNPVVDLQFVLIDLKRTEFPPFRKVPHVMDYVDTPDGAIEALASLVDEMDRRFDMFRDVCYDINGWNKTRPKEHMPRIFIWCDELALLTQGGDNKRRKRAIELILKLVSLGRSSGIHVLLGTQSVSKEVLTMPITANIDGRICYGVRNLSASVLAIGNGDAVGLRPPGRCAIVDGSDTFYLQSPIATEQDIQETVQRAIRGDFDRGEAEMEPEPERWQGIEDIIRFSRDELGGEMAYKVVWERSGRKLSRDRTQQLIRDHYYKPDENGPVIAVDGTEFVIIPGPKLKPPKGQLPARLVLAEELEPVLVPKNGQALEPVTEPVTVIDNGTHPNGALITHAK